MAMRSSLLLLRHRSSRQLVRGLKGPFFTYSRCFATTTTTSNDNGNAGEKARNELADQELTTSAKNPGTDPVDLSSTVSQFIKSGAPVSRSNSPSSSLDYTLDLHSEAIGSTATNPVFQIPDPPPPEKVLHEDPKKASQMQAFLKILDPVVNDRKFKGRHASEEDLERCLEYLQSIEPRVPSDLGTTLQNYSEQDDGKKGVRGSEFFHQKVAKQKERFMRDTGFSGADYRSIEGAILQVANFSARDGNSQVVQILWSKVLEMGLSYRGCIDTLMYVASLHDGSSRGKYSHLVRSSILDGIECDASSVDDVDLSQDIAKYHNLLFGPTDRSLAIQVRHLIEHGKGEQAEKLLSQFSGDVLLRLRNYMPLLRLYLENNDLSSAMRVYNIMKAMEGVHFDAEAYVNIIAELARYGRFAKDAEIPQEIKNHGISSTTGPGLLNELLSEMSREIFSIPLPFVKRLYNAFAEGFPGEGLEQTTSLKPLHLDQNKAVGNGLVVSRVQIDPNAGVCPCTEAKLHLVELTSKQKKRLKTSLISVALESQELFYDARRKRGLDTSNFTSFDKLLQKFEHWLNKRKGKPFTTIVDGANVGYYLQNFDGGKFSFWQIQRVVESLEALGENPLVVLPRMYMFDKFRNTIDCGVSEQHLTPEDHSIRDGLTERGKVCVVPPGSLDDYYLIAACMASQRVSSEGKDLAVEKNDPKGRWPGLRPLIVSNDQFRDHRLELREPLLFRRFYSNYVVNFSFCSTGTHTESLRRVDFAPANFFSREIQSNLVSEQTVWHFPISETDDEWLCLRIP